MRADDKNHEGMIYLKEALEIFKDWRFSNKPGLTAETFLACIQTMGVIPELTEYLQTKHEFEYLLTGKLMSDPLEGRFGWYRQTNGGNFFMSIKQLLEAEKKIRCLSLLQKEILENVSTIEKTSGPLLLAEAFLKDEEQMWLKEMFANVSLDDMPEADANVAFFVSGYVARSIVRRRKCSCCSKLLVKNIDSAEEQLEMSISGNYRELFEMANRGGLTEPTEICFSITALAVQCYTAIASDERLFQKFLCFGNQRSAFISGVRAMANSTSVFCDLLNIKCSVQHSNFDLIVQGVFNCCAKNSLKRINSRPMLKEPPKKMLRSIQKLSSKSSKQI